MIDDQGKRLSALRNRIPATPFCLRFLPSPKSVAGAFAGYASATDAKRCARSRLCHGNTRMRRDLSLSLTLIGQALAS